jgi:hypothetical protein
MPATTLALKFHRASLCFDVPASLVTRHGTRLYKPVHKNEWAFESSTKLVQKALAMASDYTGLNGCKPLVRGC